MKTINLIQIFNTEGCIETLDDCMGYTDDFEKWLGELNQERVSDGCEPLSQDEFRTEFILVSIYEPKQILKELQ